MLRQMFIRDKYLNNEQQLIVKSSLNIITVALKFQVKSSVPSV